jgi:hypothetical protein
MCIAKKMKSILKGTIFLEFGMEVTEISGTWDHLVWKKGKLTQFLMIAFADRSLLLLLHCIYMNI